MKNLTAEGRARLVELCDLVLAISALDFEKRAVVQGNGDELDALAAGLNALSEELAAKIEEASGRTHLEAIFETMSEGIIVFAADVGAYLVGRNYGRRKLAPAVSPGKSIEGALGGLALVALWAAAAGPYVFQIDTLMQWALLIAVSVFTAAVSVIGDLTESLFKRLRGLKDSGTLLPGHGGVLDRIDSILAAAPVFYLGVTLLAL